MAPLIKPITANTTVLQPAFIRQYSQLTSIVLIRSNSRDYAPGGISILAINNPDNKYILPNKFYKLLSQKG